MSDLLQEIADRAERDNRAYEDAVFAHYVNADEGTRLRLERLEPYAVGLYEHGKIWTPWPKAEADERRRTARQILWDPDHVASHHGDNNEFASCGTCELNQLGPKPPNYAGWAGIYVQAGATIPDTWRPAFADLLEETEYAKYAETVGRDVVTFGLRDPRGLVRVL